MWQSKNNFINSDWNQLKERDLSIFWKGQIFSYLDHWLLCAEVKEKACNQIHESDQKVLWETTNLVLRFKATKVTWEWVGPVHLYLGTASPKLRCSTPSRDNVRSSAQFRRGRKMQMYIHAAFINRWYGRWHLVGVMNWDLISLRGEPYSRFSSVQT